MDRHFDVVCDDDTVMVFLAGDLDLAARDSGESAVAEAIGLKPIAILVAVL